METELDLTDLVLLQYIIQANGSPAMKHIVKDDVSYVWLSHSKLHEDLPILGLSEGTLRNRISQLKKERWIVSETARLVNGSATYYSVTMQTLELLYDDESRCHSKMTSPRNSKMTSDSKLEDSKLKDISKDISESNDSSPKQFLGSAKPKQKTKQKKPTLYDKCIEKIIDYTDDEKLQKVLIDYLTVRLAIKDKPLLGVNQWVGMLNKLSKMDKQLEVVQKSIAHGWAMFYPMDGDGFNNSTDKFSEFGAVKNEKRKDEEFYGDF